ncbi:GmrSD restriction endonuclease domain-containing protein, partial [Bacillus sp. Hm123]|uniref:GmrSD restriction endonuclease domain-containing protein n=1 Tax=Bacillus sp. Hm123 TaxID=3450745 RepID=UPI003F42B93E
LETSTFNRTTTPAEKQAYKNLKSYDSGTYNIKSEKKIKKILSTDLIIPKYRPKALEITQKEIDMYIDYAQILNQKHSDFNPGRFAERNAYESSFAKKGYYNSELEFIVNLFISHHNIHAFDDGNKRTALNLFIDLIHKFTTFAIKDIITIQDSQILYLEKEITPEEFRHIIYYEVKKKVFKTNLKCNLEHLIPRSNIDDSDNPYISSQSDRRSSFNLTDLEKGQFFYQQLKKPIFQRDTNQWTVERVEKLINTFLDDGLIPAIILWEDTEGNIYIIDGAHRISSLIAWVNSDYGKKNEINDSNHKAIESYINQQIGSYSEIKSSTDEKYKRSKQIIAKRSIAVQWVTGDYDKVKESFIRINEQGVEITEDEKELIENDQLPTSQLSRAILGQGLGQVSKNQNERTRLLFNRFFMPFLSHQLNNYPLCGSLNQDFVISKVYNVVKIIDDNEKLDINLLEDKAISLLTFVQDYLNISQKAYFYGATKQFKTNSLYGFIRFAVKLNEDSYLKDIFIKNRKNFEEFLVNNERHIQTIARKKRQAKKAYEEVSRYYETLLISCKNDDFSDFKSRYNYLDFDENKHLTSKEKTIQKNYSAFISEIPRCMACGGFIDGNKNDKKIHNCCNNK